MGVASIWKEDMPLSLVATAQPAPRVRVKRWSLASYLLIGVIAVLPRVLALGQFITDDEANFWLARSDIFLKAIQSGDYAATAITAHPGVTTMWLGAAGIMLRHALLDWGVIHSDAFPVVLALMRLPVVLVHVAVILLGYSLLRRMFSGSLALLAALLWAADPFVIGYSKLLHTDALAMSFICLSLLAACLFWNHQRRWRWLLLSGVSAGLALLSKSPALILVPTIGLVALLAALPGDKRQATRDERQAQSSLVSRLWSLVSPLALWGALAAATVFALWPALSVSPLQAYRQVQIGIAIEGAQPHQLGNFFLGRADDAPGLLYYPVALALRTTPWTLLGLLLLPLAWRRDWSSVERRDLACLAGFLILFVAAMDLFPKKFDRYIVPAFPALDILAAAGLIWIAGWRLEIGDFRTIRSQVSILTSQILIVAIGLLSLINVAYWHPYSIVAFNQVLGGTRAGTQTFAVGWGEGLEQVADWLNRQPDITGVRTVALRVTSLRPYLRPGAQADFPKGDQLRDRTGYLVVYLPQVQAGQVDGVFAQFYGRVAPLHTVRIHGVDFAWIYRAPAQAAHARPAAFGPGIRLYGFDQNGTVQRGQTLHFTLVWDASPPPSKDYWLFAHLIGPGNQRYAQLDVPYPTSQWAPGRFATTELPIALPPDAPIGGYRLLVGLYDQPTGQRLPLTTTVPGAVAAGEVDAFVLTQFDVK
jgi:4-amino-4-deoxy-L-arabinose transferase-like glycosyltransferase